MKYLKSLFASALVILFGSAYAQNPFGLPENISQGNILHCFDWKFNDVKNALPDIAEAGFVAVQVSPTQAASKSGYNWSNLYRPYDFDFYEAGLGTESQLQTLCEEAEKYGIKIVVDVVFNHVDNSGYHNSWWNSNGRLRSTTAYVNYNNRTSITSDRIGSYPEVNTEQTEVIARAKAYIQKLHDLGVRGIRFDAAKHIALPSEGSPFWKEVTSIPDMFYYGEILDTPGGSNATTLMKEYTEYMFVTDDSYSRTVRSNAGVPSASGNWVGRGIDGSKLVLWGESHDEFANEGGATKNTKEATIDRAYANVASRNNGIALYFSRPAKSSYSDIRVGQKGSTRFMEPQVAEVNKFKNAMVGKEEYYSRNSSGSAAVISRKDGGAVIINRSGAGSVDVPNSNSYCPVGIYKDRVSGNEFTVTATNITGTVGESGIAVIYASNNETGVEDVTIDNEAFDLESAAWYTLQGVRVNRPTEKGIFIAVSPSGRTRKMVIR